MCSKLGSFSCWNLCTKFLFVHKLGIILFATNHVKEQILKLEKFSIQKILKKKKKKVGDLVGVIYVNKN